MMTHYKSFDFIRFFQYNRYLFETYVYQWLYSCHVFRICKRNKMQLEWNRQSAIRLMLHVVVVILNFVFFCRYDISFKTISGDAKSVTEEMMAPWLETTLPTILSRYPLENIFNGDEFGLTKCFISRQVYWR